MINPEQHERVCMAAHHLSQVLDDMVDSLNIPPLYLEHISAAQRMYTDAFSES